MKHFIFITLCVILHLASCTSSSLNEDQSENLDALDNNLYAHVVSVEISESSVQNAFDFSVGIESIETGCGQYANWWEVITPAGTLLYRRILAHSHINEQPFVRSGGPVRIEASTVVYVRAHMHPTGYGGTAFRGSFENGFDSFDLNSTFATELAEQDPLPTGCAG